MGPKEAELVQEAKEESVDEEGKTKHPRRYSYDRLWE